MSFVASILDSKLKIMEVKEEFKNEMVSMIWYLRYDIPLYLSYVYIISMKFFFELAYFFQISIWMNIYTYIYINMPFMYIYTLFQIAYT